MRKVICIGSACKDIFFPTADGTVVETPDDLLSQKKITFELGAKYKVENRFESSGGCAANVACGLARLGVGAACYSHIGDDYSADWIRGELIKNSVDASLITKEKDCPSDLSAIIVDANSGDRVIFSNQKANSRLEIIPEKIVKTSWFFLGDLHGEWEKHLDQLVYLAKENGIKIAFNPRQANIHDNVGKIIEIISAAQVLFLNKDEAMEIVSQIAPDVSNQDMGNEVFLSKKLLELGAGVVVVTDGVRGAWGYDGAKLIHVAALLNKNALDSTGAGDAFASGFLAAHIKGKKLEDGLCWGIANSSSSVGFFGGVEGLLDEEALQQRAATCQIEKL
jgi:sugar/nucleoside kinase (ribokinase family)